MITLSPGRIAAAASHGSLTAWLAALLAQASAPLRVRPAPAADAGDVRASRDGDGDAFGRLVERHRDQVARRMWKFTRDREAYEELVHEVFVEAYLSLGRYREMDSFGGWLNTIATRVGYRFWRGRKRSRRTVSLADRDVAVEADPPADADEAAAKLHATLAQLAHRDRLVLTLMYWEGYSVAETSRQTGWSQSMVKVQAHRARKRLRKLLLAAGLEVDE